MKRRTFVYVACSPHPRVGKTVTARLLTDYFVTAGRQVVGFDTNPHDSGYARSHPETTTIADIGTTRGQVGMFDRLIVPDEIPKVIDLWHPSYRPFLATAKDLGLFEEARRRGITFTALFHADPSAASLEACQGLAERWPDIRIVLVSNEGVAPADRHDPEHLARYRIERWFRIPKLDPPAASALDDPDLSLRHLLRSPSASMSLGLHADLLAWIRRIFAQFQAFELRQSLEDAEYLR